VRCFVFITACLLPLAAGAFELPATTWSPRSQVCPRTTEALVIDGRLDEPSWQGSPESEAFVDIRGADAPPPRHETHVRLLWDDQNLYVGATLVEPHLWATYTERDAVIYHENDFEVFLDPDGDCHDYAELELNALNTVWDLLLVKPYRDGGPALDGWDIKGLRTAVNLDGTLNDPRDTDRGWSVEIAIPWRALKECAGAMACPPAANDTWRLNFSRVQWQRRVEKGSYVKLTGDDGKPLAEDNWVWSPQGLIAMHYPECWGFVTFSGLPAGTALPRAEIPQDLIGGPRFLMAIYYAERLFFESFGYYASSLGQLEIQDDAQSFLMQRFDQGWLNLHATAWQFEARLEWHNRIFHVDQTGHLWQTPKD
jgi:hypothetical protein